MSDSPLKPRGGRRPGAGRPPTGNAKTIVQERVPPELAAHCKAAQASQPGYLARLIQEDYLAAMRAYANSPNAPDDLWDVGD